MTQTRQEPLKFPLPLWKFGLLKTRIGYLAPNPSVIIGDLERNQLVDNFSELSSHRLLVMSVSRWTPQATGIMQNVMEAVFSRNSLFNRLKAKEVKQLFQTHLSMERGFFENPEAQLSAADYHAFFLVQNRVYPLHQEATETCYIYRQGRLLSFQLTPHQFVALEPHDLFLVAHPEDIEDLVSKKSFRHLHKVFQNILFLNPSGKKGFARIRQKLKAPLIGIYHKTVLPQQPTPVQNIIARLTREHWILISFLGMWIIALIAAYCLGLTQNAP